jgi:hypothetical protein
VTADQRRSLNQLSSKSSYWSTVLLEELILSQLVKIFRALRNQEVHYRFHRNLPLDAILKQTSPKTATARDNRSTPDRHVCT